MRSILIATDLSARSDRTLERAVNLARDRGGELTIVHVVYEDLPASLADARQKAAESVLSQISCSVLAVKPPDFVTPVTLE